MRVFIKRIMRIIAGMPAFAVMLILLSAAACPGAETSYDATPLTNLIPGWPQMRQINEASAVVMDADNGGILYSLNRDTVRYPASITKILTALITIENASLDEVVTMDETGIALTAAGSTNAGTVNGEEFTVEQCLYIMMLKSANDIATQLGKHVGGSVSGFADMMNARAEEIGCTGSHFVNPSGMPDSDHYSTAMDMALIMRECLRNDLFRKIISTRSYTVPPTNMNPEERVYDNHCSLIQPGSEYYYSECIGGKTGFTQAAWRTLVTAAERDGRTLICVTMRGPDKTDYTDTRDLFEYGFGNFSVSKLDGVPVNLPDGFDVSLLEAETRDVSEGKVLRTWKYKKMPVGSAVTDAVIASADAGETVGNAAPAEELSNKVKSYGGIIVRHLLPALLVFFFFMILIVLVMMISAGSRSRKRRKRRRRK